MQFRDLNAQYNRLKDEIDEGIKSVINSSSYILGSQVKELESKLRDYVGVKHCISCANGTDALILPLMAWNICEGDAVFVPDFTFFATVNCVMGRGATPVLVDIEEDTFNISPDALEEAISNVLKEGKLNPKLVIPVDLFGQCANYDRIIPIAEKYNIKILEDGAQGFGGTLRNKKACSFGDVSTTSFFPAKPLGCYGDGGAMFTDDDLMAEKLISMRSQGRSATDKYDNLDIGLNSRLDTLQAAILLPKLKAFIEFELETINSAAERYRNNLKTVVKTPVVPNGYKSSWAQFTILLKDNTQRNGLRNHLKGNGIPSMIYYPKGMHQQTAIIKHGFTQGMFPITEKIVETCLSLPIHPYISIDDIDFVSEKVIDFVEINN